MIEKLVKNPGQTIGPRRPVADPGRPLIVKGELDEIIAGGLGLDVEALRKMGDKIGMLAALSQTEVPLANRTGNIEIGKQAVSALRSALNVELNRALNVAAPQLTLKSRGAARAVTPKPDALDELIKRVSDESDEEELS
jgi:hypothetical protein